MDTSDWRTQLRPSTRKRSFNKIRNTLKTYHYFGDEDGLLELQKIAQSFEEKSYAGATSKFDYSRKIAFKLRLMESKFQNTTFKPHLMETSLDSTAQTGQPNGGDWQEEVYQKITTMKENYLPELNEMYQKIATKLQQHDSLPQQPKSDQLEKLKLFKMMLERIITFLQVSKSSILPNFKEKLGSYEKQIINFINTNRPRKAMSSLQPGHLAPPHMHSMSQPQSQVTQVQSHENPMNSQLQTTNIQGPVATMQQNNMASMQHSSMSGVSTAQQMETGTMVNNIPSNQVGPSNKPPDPASLDSTAQTGQPNGGDWQEEVYQKITTMKENYLPELNEMYQKIATKLQQHDSLPQQPKSDQLEKLKVFKMMLERIITFLQVSKSSILPNFKEKLGSYEKQIINFINTNRPRKAMSSLQPGHLAPPHMHSMSQPQSQVTQVQSHENPMNSQLQTTNIQGPVATMQQNNMASMQHSSMSGVSTAPQMETGTNVNNIPSNQVGPSNKPPDPEEASDWRVQLQLDSRQRIGKPNHVGQPFTEEASDWRVQLQPDSRQRIVNKIMDTLNKHLPVSGPEGLLEIWRIAQRFEEKIFTAATNQSDYLRKISLKMLTMDTTSRGHHGQPSNQFGPDNKPAGPDLRKQSNRSKRRPTWTDDYIMG